MEERSQLASECGCASPPRSSEHSPACSSGACYRPSELRSQRPQPPNKGCPTRAWIQAYATFASANTDGGVRDASDTQLPLRRGPSSTAIPSVQRLLSNQLPHVSCRRPEPEIGAQNDHLRALATAYYFRESTSWISGCELRTNCSLPRLRPGIRRLRRAIVAPHGGLDGL